MTTSIVSRLPALRQAVNQHRDIIFIVDVDPIVERKDRTTIQNLNARLSALEESGFEVIIASRLDRAAIQTIFPGHRNFIAATGSYVQLEHKHPGSIHFYGETVPCRSKITELAVDPPTPSGDGMWSGISLALTALDYENRNNLVVYIGPARHDNTVAMQEIKARGGLTVLLCFDTGTGRQEKPDYHIDAALDDPHALLTLCREATSLAAAN